MHHRNAPLTVVGRQRAVAQVVDSGRPIAHVAAEFHIARTTLSKGSAATVTKARVGSRITPARQRTALPVSRSGCSS